jgi:hypothetical protein
LFSARTRPSGELAVTFYRMGKPYSDDLRERVIAAIEAGHTRVQVAELYNMALSLAATRPCHRDPMHQLCRMHSEANPIRSADGTALLERKTVIVWSASLVSWHTRSCGCLCVSHRLRHGHSRRGNMSSEYVSWQGMLARCYNKNRRDYKGYGGSGVTVTAGECKLG